MGASNSSTSKKLDPKKIIGSTANQKLQNAIIASIRNQDPTTRKQLVKNAAGGDTKLEAVFMQMLENDKIVRNDSRGLSPEILAFKQQYNDWVIQQIPSLTSLDGLRTFITTLCGIINGRMEDSNQVAPVFDDREIGNISFKKTENTTVKGNYFELNNMRLRHCSAGEGNDCLLQAFLTDTCPDFCRMTQQTKNSVGSILRRVVLPLIPRFSTLPANLEATHLKSTQPLGDEVAAELAQQFQVNIGLFLHLSSADTLQYPYMTYANDPIQLDGFGRVIHAPEHYPVFLDRHTIIIFNWGGGHYSSVCRKQGGRDNYLFDTENTLSARDRMAQNRTTHRLVCDLAPITEPNYRVVPDPRANQFVAPQQMAAEQLNLKKLSPEDIITRGFTKNQINNLVSKIGKNTDAMMATTLRNIQRQYANASAPSHKNENADLQSAVAASLGPQELPAEVKVQFELARVLLLSINRDMITTKADGNCFFWAVEGYGQIKGIPQLQGVQALRNAVAEELEKEEYKAFFTKSSNILNVNQRTLEQHRNDIRVFETNKPVPSKSWADHTDIVAFANHFNVCVRIFDFREQIGDLNEINIPDQCKGKDAIELVRVRKHYQLVMLKDDPHYLALQRSVFEQGIPIELPLSNSGLDLREYHPLSVVGRSAAAARNVNPLSGNANAAASNFNKFSLNPASSSALHNASSYNISLLTPEQLEQQRAIQESFIRSPAQAATSNSLTQHAQNAQNALSQVSLKPKKSKEEIQKEIKELKGMIATLKAQIKILEISDPKGILLRKREQLTEKEEKLGRRQAGTGKRKTRKKCHNKNKSRRRL